MLCLYTTTPCVDSFDDDALKDYENNLQCSWRLVLMGKMTVY